ncbi:hypothetical protein DPMN_050522 [Dreissena polymorpha]|uniref:Uncharacterized protein n=1 Tax=Dreissena polymorpha TaxID=45954 RepID=A0A9D4CGA1_DREPO|nr:hypothetical protein DPMN_050522 [Dreissena polymorpha]
MNRIKIYSHVQLACAAAPMDSQEDEQEESRRVHEVKKAPTPDGVSVSVFDKLTQVVEQQLYAVERLSNSSGSLGVDHCVRKPGQRFRNEGGYAKYPVVGPYPGNVQIWWYNDQRQGMYPVGSSGGV